MKQEMLAMILAGGQGSRLGVFTKRIAKPAVSFGGKYRIIDFVLSNCSNSGIDTVGVLTQYRPRILNSHIGMGSHWDLDRINGGVYILQPYMSEKEGHWFNGTANAIYKNMNFIDDYDPEYVLILSGDHIYKMDYSKMLEFHKEKKSEATIAVIEVPWDEASRFGIMNADDDKKIYEFEEKPKNPKSNLASMGVYIFNWKKLKEYFLRARNTKECFDDFGKDVIPAMLKDSQEMYAYPFKGYWRDVGTIQSLWEANMDLINTPDAIELSNSNWTIYTNTMDLPPQYIGQNASIKEALIADGCSVLGTIENTILSHKVEVGEGSIIRNSVIMPNVTIGKNVIIEKAMVAEGAVINDNAVIKSDTNEISIVSEYEVVRADEKVEA
ncbi:MAG: glucose-1-phosphate adenylyltransferase [Terrisporobacter othiniensis]|uniref:Glucose-1-phosphate adenylyltransferase n=2 Tax=Terrisporobacter TaxID=1505652 RepID=A0AAX2ZD17_9FIRM|nr:MULTISPECIES: glucose-1-phosphate adenylyltransferase [Terrisporobacter]MBN9648526.1 glucose-1-phosphate adenylyltransferase [Terrisporobacter glycolicus]MDU4861438.1 glucose-1-phosphate adenylyltransferase [Terrisporobacter othiniensis]MDU6994613.1 glucose-1-phosphate adenylyltransferase [Terrisporobacter othiniensis]UEL46287.1 glucose-1-phosphate adenylyltransferase [Terrisporobacter hibernicus]UPA30097.1 glucose-1-phosphate adenylyltransferase [Terrisporobacter glycolicus]